MLASFELHYKQNIEKSINRYSDFHKIKKKNCCINHNKVHLDFHSYNSKSIFFMQAVPFHKYYHIRDRILTVSLVGERAKRARHYQGCTNSSWCGTYIYTYICYSYTMGTRGI